MSVYSNMISAGGVSSVFCFCFLFCFRRWVGGCFVFVSLFVAIVVFVFI